MWLDLRLKGIKTDLLQLMLFQFYLFHQHLDFIHHRVKTNCKLCEIFTHIVNIDPCSQGTCCNMIHLRYYLIKGLIHFPDQRSYNNAYYEQYYDQNQNHNNHYMESWFHQFIKRNRTDYIIIPVLNLLAYIHIPILCKYLYPFFHLIYIIYVTACLLFIIRKQYHSTCVNYSCFCWRISYSQHPLYCRIIEIHAQKPSCIRYFSGII